MYKLGRGRVTHATSVCISSIHMTTFLHVLNFLSHNDYPLLAYESYTHYFFLSPFIILLVYIDLLVGCAVVIVMNPFMQRISMGCA